MDTPIKVLHLEDDKSVVEIVNFLLVQNKLLHELIHVQTEEEFTKALLEHSFDIIIADYSLPDFDGLSALRILRERNKITPFILFSGSIGEERAIESLKMGCTDYVLKQNVKALIPAVKRALREAKDRKQKLENENVLYQRERILSSISSAALDAIIMMDSNGDISFWNNAAEKIFGYTHDEAIGKNLHSLIVPVEYIKKFESQFPHFKKTGQGPAVGKVVELEAVHKDGNQFQVELSLSAVKLEDHWGAVGIVRDITERKLAEESLKESEEKYRDLVEKAGIAILVDDLEGDLTYFNDNYCKMFGYSKSEMQNLSRDSLILPEDLKRINDYHESRMQNKNAPTNYHCRCIRKDGSIIHVEVDISKFKKSGQVVGTINYMRDITERINVENALQASEVRYRTLFESTGDAIMMLDEKGFFDCNPITLSMFGVAYVKQFCMMHPADLSPDKQSDGMDSMEAANMRIKTALKKGSHRFEWVHKRFNSGEQFPAEVLLSRMTLDGKQVLQASVRDITERKKMESQLANAQKLESIGQLAAGIAHEINTPAQYVGDNVHFLKDAFTDFNKLWEIFRQMKASRDELPHLQTLLDDAIEIAELIDFDFLIDEIPVAIDQTLDGIESVSKIVKAMKEFSHPGSKEMMLIDLNRAIENTLIVSRNEWKYIAEIKTKFDESLGAVPCYPDELNQVLLNMIINATHAISEKKFDGESKGIISIQTIPDNNEAQIRISDNGNGIPKDNMNKIFDLFFTTKEVGKGTGQGLAIAHDVIVNKHHGTIDVESEVGYGTTFILRLPMDKS